MNPDELIRKHNKKHPHLFCHNLYTPLYQKLILKDYYDTIDQSQIYYQEDKTDVEAPVRNSRIIFLMIESGQY